MKKVTTYYGVQKISYEFTKSDVLKALGEYYKLPVSKANKIEFDLYEKFEERPEMAELVLSFNKSEGEAREEG